MQLPVPLQVSEPLHHRPSSHAVPTPAGDWLHTGPPVLQPIVPGLQVVPQVMFRLQATHVPVPGLHLRAIHVPGHSEGQVVLHDEADNVLFSADHVLERVTPNPTVYIPPYRGKTTGLGDYLASLDRLRSLPEDVLVCPGHGRPFRGLNARLDEIRAHHDERARQILGLVEKREEATIVSLAREIWRGLKEAAVVLAAREVHGHLDLLEQQGLVSREERSGAWIFRRAG